MSSDSWIETIIFLIIIAFWGMLFYFAIEETEYRNLKRKKYTSEDVFLKHLKRQIKRNKKKKFTKMYLILLLELYNELGEKTKFNKFALNTAIEIMLYNINKEISTLQDFIFLKRDIQERLSIVFLEYETNRKRKEATANYLMQLNYVYDERIKEMSKNIFAKNKLAKLFRRYKNKIILSSEMAIVEIDNFHMEIDYIFIEYKKIKEKKLTFYKNKQNLSSKELGDRYERYIGYLYEMQDYRVDFIGIIKGKEDGGIDLIAENKDEILLIQCKRYGKDNFVRENAINQLFGTYMGYKRRRRTKKKIIPILYTANDNLDKMAKVALNDLKEIKHIIKQYDNDYPLVKCNINGENRIYHTPLDPSYDTIKIEPKKGEFYAYTIKEAEDKGFREPLNRALHYI